MTAKAGPYGELPHAYIVAQAMLPGSRQRCQRPGANSLQREGPQQTTPTSAPGP